MGVLHNSFDFSLTSQLKTPTLPPPPGGQLTSAATQYIHLTSPSQCRSVCHLVRGEVGSVLVCVYTSVMGLCTEHSWELCNSIFSDSLYCF